MTITSTEKTITNSDNLDKTIAYIVSINKMLTNVLYAIIVLSKNTDSRNFITKLMSKCDDAMLSYRTFNLIDIEALINTISIDHQIKLGSLIIKLTCLRNTLSRLHAMSVLHHDITCIKYPHNEIIIEYNSTYPNAVSLNNILQLRQRCDMMLDAYQYKEYKNSFFTPKN